MANLFLNPPIVARRSRLKSAVVLAVCAPPAVWIGLALAGLCPHLTRDGVTDVFSLGLFGYFAAKEALQLVRRDRLTIQPSGLSARTPWKRFDCAWSDIIGVRLHRVCGFEWISLELAEDAEVGGPVVFRVFRRTLSLSGMWDMDTQVLSELLGAARLRWARAAPPQAIAAQASQDLASQDQAAQDQAALSSRPSPVRRAI